MRALIYVDSVYRKVDGAIYGDLAFTTFLAALAAEMDVTIIGRLALDEGPARYRVPDEVEFIALPHYASLAEPRAALSSLAGSLRLFWRALPAVDCAWLFGPYLHAQLFAALALIRKRRVVLGVRQNFPDYVRSRRPTLRWMHIAADLLEYSWRAMARRLPTVVVGPALERDYRHSRRLLAVVISLISEADIRAGEAARDRVYDGELQLLSVGRLDEEKNPLLLADALALLRRRDPRWRLVVCGDGPLQGPLRERLSALGVGDAAQLRGHVALRDGLLELYRASHAFLHVSRTEGFPQVLVEAFACGVPVVATAVGGVPVAAGDAALLIDPESPEAAADAVQRVAADADLRDRLLNAGFARVQQLTMQSQIKRVARFLDT